MFGINQDSTGDHTTRTLRDSVGSDLYKPLFPDHVELNMVRTRTCLFPGFATVAQAQEPQTLGNATQRKAETTY